MKKHLIICLALLLLSISAMARLIGRQDRDSLRAIVNNKNLPDTVRLFNACYFTGTFDYVMPDSMLYFARKYHDESVRLKYLYGITYTTVLEGWWYSEKGQDKEAMKRFLEALETAERCGQPLLLGFVYGEVGTGYSQLLIYDKAIDYQLRSIRIYRSLKEHERELRRLNNLAHIYGNMGNYAKGIEIILRAMAIADSLKLDPNSKGSALHALGNFYKGTGKPAEAVKAYAEALRLHRKTKNMFFCRITLYSLADFFYDDKQDLYGKEIGDSRPSIDISLSYLEELEKISIESRDSCMLAQCYSLSGLGYVRKGERTKALEMADKTKKLGFNGCDIGTKIRTTEILAKIYSKTGDHEKSVLEYVQLIELVDSADRAKMAEKVRQLTESFEIEQVEGKLSQKEQELRTNRYIKNLFITISGLIFLLALILLYFFRHKQKAARILTQQNQVIQMEKDRSEELLLNILPSEVAEELKQTGHCKAKTFSMVTVMFMDFKDFTSVSERVSAELLVDEINSCFSAFDGIIQKYRIEKIKTVGDSYICAGGLPMLNQTHAADTLNAAIEIRDFMIARKKEKDERGEFAFEMRIGIHTGPVVAGIVGVKKFQYDIWGDTVNLAARMEQNSEAEKINISGSTYKLVKEKFNCIFRGKIEAKNKGELEMYFVEGAAS